MVRQEQTLNYSKALFQIKGSLEEIQKREQDLAKISSLIKEHPKILYFLGCPDVDIGAKVAFLEKHLDVTLDNYVKKLIEQILKRRLAASIRRISKEYHKLVVGSLQEVDVKVVSAEPLSEKTKADLKERLHEKFKKKVNLFEVINHDLLGGFAIYIGNQLLDLSLKASLLKLKRTLLKADYDTQI